MNGGILNLTVFYARGRKTRAQRIFDDFPIMLSELGNSSADDDKIQIENIYKTAEGLGGFLGGFSTTSETRESPWK